MVKFGTFLKTPFGRFYLEATERGLYRIVFPKRYIPPPLSFLPRGRVRKGGGSAASHLAKAERLLSRYLEGHFVSFKGLKLDGRGFSPFEKRVLKVLSQVPYGGLRTYRDLAKKAGSPQASRAVGSVLGRNRLPIILPCHRIVRSSGGLGGYSQGIGWKKRLLQLEKVSTPP